MFLIYTDQATVSALTVVLWWRDRQWEEEEGEGVEDGGTRYNIFGYSSRLASQGKLAILAFLFWLREGGGVKPGEISGTGEGVVTFFRAPPFPVLSLSLRAIWAVVRELFPA